MCIHGLALLFCPVNIQVSFYTIQVKSPLPFSRRHYFPIINIEYAILATFNGFFFKVYLLYLTIFQIYIFWYFSFKFYILVRFIFQNGRKCTGMPLIYNLKVSKWIENSDQMALVKNENVDNCNESNHEFYEYLHFLYPLLFSKKIVSCVILTRMPLSCNWNVNRMMHILLWRNM